MSAKGEIPELLDYLIYWLLKQYNLSMNVSARALKKSRAAAGFSTPGGLEVIWWA